MRRLVALLLALLLPSVTVAQAGPQGPPPEPAISEQQAAADPEAPAQVDPALMNKKVVVHLRDGGVYKGKLIGLTQDSLRLKTDGRTDEIALAQVTMVERQRSRAWLGVAIAGIAVAAVAVGALIAAMQD